MKKKMNYLILLTTIFMVGCTNVEDASITDREIEPQEVTTDNTTKNSKKEETITTVVDEPVVKETATQPKNDLFSGYKLIEVDGGNLSGHRESKVVVDIGFGDREY
jgi:PBP1b-binding outer membrane lipoprotein LpoB